MLMKGFRYLRDFGLGLIISTRLDDCNDIKSVKSVRSVCIQSLKLVSYAFKGE